MIRLSPPPSRVAFSSVVRAAQQGVGADSRTTDRASCWRRWAAAAQRQGVGSKLIEAGNRQLKDAGCPFIVVVGHADYYSRFGFRPARPVGITCEWEVPDNVFLLLVLDPGKMQGVSGIAKYRHEFSTVS